MRQSVEVPFVRIDPASGDDAGTVDDHDQLVRGFQRLKPHHRAAIVLHFYLDLSVPDVADALGVPVGTAKSRIHYAVEALRAALAADERAPIATDTGAHTMINDRSAEERIRSWMIATAPRHLPDRVLTDTHDRTRRMAQASSARTWWSRMTRPLPIVFAAGALAVVVVLVNVRLGSLGGGANRPLGVQFGNTAQISGQWTTAQSEAFSVQFANPEDEHLYWRAAVYDDFDLTAWSQTVSGGYDVAGGEEVLARAVSRSTETGRRAVTFRVFPTDFRGSSIVSPQSPQRIDTPVRVSYVGDAKFIASVDRAGGDPYTVTALVPERGDDTDGALTINRLRAAGTAYPAGDPQALPHGSRWSDPAGRRRGEAPRGHPCRGGRTRTTRTTSQARWSTTCSRPPTSSTTPTSATWPARACRPSSASPGTAMATASTTRRRWRSSSASTASRRAWLPASCPANAMTRDSSSACRSARHTPGSRSTFPGTAGWSSTRRAAASRA